ncbi:MAG: hypothetical protein HKN16_12290, partial [Saprospiraceae bacterium]|nr:hypothetical protein [Saprospiraceae bacterium]
MKTILQYIREFWKLDFDSRVYGATALVLALAIGFNYYFDLEDGFIDSFRKTPFSFVVYFLYYAAPYLAVLGIYKIFSVRIPGKMDKAFWITLLFALAILTFRVGFYWHEEFLSDLRPFRERYYYTKLSRAFINILVQGLGIMLLYLFWEKHNKNWYGFSWKNFKWQPYALMLLIMV